MTDELLAEYRRRLLAQYRDQVDRYAVHLDGLGDGPARTPIKPAEWSAHQVLFHVALVDEQAYGPRLRRILREDHPTLDDFDQDRWMEERYDPGVSTQALLDRWRAVRLGYAAEVEAAPSDAWNRSGLQAFWGERTLQWWVERAVTHGDDHWRQLLGE